MKERSQRRHLSVLITARISPAEFEQVTASAAAAGLTISSFVRSRICNPESLCVAAASVPAPAAAASTLNDKENHDV